MPVVYSPEEVKNGHVAKDGDHAALGKRIIRLVDTEKAIIAIQIYGSTALGTASLCSDMDGLVIYEDGARTTAIEAIRSVSFAARTEGNYAKTEIHLEPATPPKRSTRLGNREYLAHFERICQQYPQWSVNNPAQYLDRTPATAEEYLADAINAFEAKTEKFTKASLKPEVDYGALQRALELPVSAARKVQHVSGLRISPQPSEQKLKMVELGGNLLRSLIGTYPSAKSALVSHNSLQALNTVYTVKLSEAVSTGNVEKYIDFLEGSRDVILKTAVELSSIWHEILTEL